MMASTSEEKPARLLRNYNFLLIVALSREMKKVILKNNRRLRRKKHIRKDLTGTKDKPRFTIFRSLNNVYAQLIDDVEGQTLVSASTLDQAVKEQIKPKMKKSEMSKLVGKVLAQRALEKEIQEVGFDRNGYLYHGRVKALADGAREGGLKF